MFLETGLPFSSRAVRILFLSALTRGFSASGVSSCGSSSDSFSLVPLLYITVSMKSMCTRGLRSSSRVARAITLVRRSSNLCWMASTSAWVSTLFLIR